MTQAVLRRRQASQGRFFRLRRSRAWPKLLWMVNLRRRATAAEAASEPASAASPLGGLCIIRRALPVVEASRQIRPEWGRGTDPRDDADRQWGYGSFAIGQQDRRRRIPKGAVAERGVRRVKEAKNAEWRGKKVGRRMRGGAASRGETGWEKVSAPTRSW